MKAVRFILFVLLGIVSVSPLKDAASSLLVHPLSFQEVLRQISSPEQVAEILDNYFVFVDDSTLFGAEDYWQQPEEFWGRGAGDCEDYALFAKQALEQIGIEAYVVSIYGAHGYAHTITAYLDGDRYNILNESKLHTYRAESIEDALSMVNPDWIWAGIAETRGTRGWMLRELRNR